LNVVSPPWHLLAIGTISGAFGDLASRTAGPPENGVAGNLLGGMGSGLAYAGGNTFIALPDRGPNAAARADRNSNRITRGRWARAGVPF
jgi:hypothetical protein